MESQLENNKIKTLSRDGPRQDLYIVELKNNYLVLTQVGTYDNKAKKKMHSGSNIFLISSNNEQIKLLIQTYQISYEQFTLYLNLLKCF